MPRHEDDVFVDAGAGLGGCTLFMAFEGAPVIAVEGGHANLFRLTSALLAGSRRPNVTVVAANLTAGGGSLDVLLHGRAPRIRLLRVSDTEDARAVLRGATRLLDAGAVRTVLVQSTNSSASQAACRELQARGYATYVLAAAMTETACAAPLAWEPHDIVAHFVSGSRG